MKERGKRRARMKACKILKAGVIRKIEGNLVK